MVHSVDDAVALIKAICRLPGSADFIQATANLAHQSRLPAAIESHDSAALYGWLMESFSFQGISDRVAWGFIQAHGNANWSLIEASLEQTRCPCPKLGDFTSYQRCGYRKSARTCGEIDHIDTCPVPRLPLRKGDLNQLAYSLYYFIHDRCDGDLVDFIDRVFANVDADAPSNPITEKRDALIDELSQIHAVSAKLIAMTFAVLLMTADPARPDWILVGRSFVAIDTLVHNF